ncbi:hypothetical protein [Brevibacterium litoralis]|uniref:hypothetical protein n=1 Tax=Brevibacterium litoralis TaxID=3138935 RepID=UPI0032EBB1D0
MTETNTETSNTEPSNTPLRPRLALGLGVLAVLAFAVMGVFMENSGGTEGEVLTSTDSMRIMIAFVPGVLVTVAALLAAVQPIIENVGRRLSLIASVIALTAPITGTAIARVIGLLLG